jgi:predicted aminopeptidase
MKKNIKRILRLLAIVIICLLAYNYKLVGYGLSQGYGQFKIIWEARPVEDVLSDARVADSLKQKLKLIQEIRKYAIDSIGVKNSKNYTTVYDQKGKTILWVVTASEPYDLIAYTWNFPFLGSVPYKGFFVKEKAIKERDDLDKKGYDTEMGTVSGWSTLGWFKDPILSNMLFKSEGNVAELIIHELTHATIYVEDSVDYNENLATFIGKKGAIAFLKHKYGSDSKELKDYIFEIEDEDVFSAFVLKGGLKLDSLYKSFRADPSQDREKLKRFTITEIVNSLDSNSFHQPARYLRRINREKINNAYFMSYKRYEEKQDHFEQEYQEKSKGDLKIFLKDMVRRYGKN